MLRKILIMLAVLILPLQAWSQRFSASIEDVGGYYRLSFTINASGVSGFIPPSLSAFEILSGPSSYSSSSYQMINGKTSHSESTTYTYVLSARKSGHVTIGPASISVNGRTVRSNSISVNVQGGGGQGGNASGGQSNHQASTSQQASSGVQQAGSPVTQRDLFIDVTPSRTRVKEQEAVLLTYRIHSRVGVGLSNTSLMQKPDFKGLISQELPLPGNQIQTSLERRGNATYRTGTILQYVVFPQKSGNIVIPSITFNCAVVQQDNTMDLADLFFNGGGTMSVQVKRTVPQITLHVDPLPSPRPANFSGAVGKFSISSKMLNPTVKTNDVATYRITLSGLGNLKLITAPTINFPKDFDTYDAKTNDNTKVSTSGLHGELTFDYTFVPRNVGDYTIPSVSFIYFDTATNSYQTLHTQPIHLHVAKGERSNADVDKQLALLKSDIRPLHEIETGSIFAWGKAGFWVLVALWIIAAFAVWCFTNAWNASRADVIGRKQRNAGKQTMKRLRAAQAILSGKATGDFHAAVINALHGFIADTFNIGQADLSTERIQAELSERGIDASLTDRLLKLIETCQYAQYAPGSSQDKQATFDEAVSVINSLTHELHPSKK
mgnify:FL=1